MIIKKAVLDNLAEIKNIASIAEVYSPENEDKIYISIDENNKILAFIAWRNPAEEEAELLSIAVLPEFRGQKIADDLLYCATNIWEKEGVKNIFLEVKKSNEIAQNLYKKFNFQQIAVRKNYYKDDDALIFKLNL